MSVTSAQPAGSAKPAPPVKRARGEGQWALGHREPLNPNERTKKDDDGLNVRARIETIYAHRGFASIDPADLRGRMRWWGLYTQRRPGIDGGRTAVLEPHELDDEYFMLRIRVDGGQLDLAQLRTIAEVSTRYGRDTRRPDRPAERPAPLGTDRGRAGHLAGAGSGRPVRPPRRAATPRGWCSAARSPGSRPTRCSTRRRPSARSCAATSATSVTPTCRASSSRWSPGCPTCRTRPTTSPSSASTTRSTGPGSTCGSAAACRPTRCWPSGSAPGFRSTRCPTSGPAWSGSSATTATAGCAAGPG